MQVCRSALAAAALVVATLPTVRPAWADPIGLQWPQPEGKGSAVVITYSYSNLLNGAFLLLTPDQLKAATRESLGLWAAHAPLHFVERPDSGPPPSDRPYAPASHPQIRVGHHVMADWGHAYYPGTSDGRAGDIHLVTGAPWALGSGSWNILEVLTHEIGHALGLGHELLHDAMMNPSFSGRYSGLGSAFLFPADIRDIQSVYGAGRGSVQPLAPVPEPVSIALIATSLGAVLLQRHVRSRAAFRRRDAHRAG